MRREVPPVTPALLPPREGVADVAEVTALPRAELLPVPRTEPSGGWGRRRGWRVGGEGEAWGERGSEGRVGGEGKFLGWAAERVRLANETHSTHAHTAASTPTPPHCSTARYITARTHHYTSPHVFAHPS